MDTSNYQRIIWQLFSDSIKSDTRNRLIYLAGKLSSEVSELVEIVDNDIESIIDEAGDVAWYLYNIYSVLNAPPPNNTVLLKSGQPIISLVESSGKLLGELLKIRFHGKDISEEKILSLVDSIHWNYCRFLREYEITEDQVLAFNVEKLRKRHGDRYSNEFYKNGS